MPRNHQLTPATLAATALLVVLAALGGPAGAGPAGAPTDRPARAAVPCRDLDTSQPGVTADTVRVANVADVTGPVPDLFLAAQQAVEAYVASFNARHDLCGRAVLLDTHDSRTDAGRDQQAYATACEEDLAAIGSMSAFDSGGAATAEQCGLPDLRAGSVTAERRACDTCLAVHPTDPATVGRAVPRHLARTEPDAVARAAVVYLEGWEAAAQAALEAADREGWDVVYSQLIAGAEPSYLPYAQQVEARGVRLLWFFGPVPATVRMQEAMRQWGYVPELFLQDETIYDPAYVDAAGPDAQGVLVDLPHALLGDRDDPEVRRYRRWLERVHPDARPSSHGLWAWSAAKLALTTMRDLGGALDRASLLAALREVDAWTAGGLHPAQHVGTQRESRCGLLARREGARWVRVTRDPFLCAPLARADAG